MSIWETLGTVVGIALAIAAIFYDPLADDSWWKGDDEFHEGMNDDD